MRPTITPTVPTSRTEARLTGSHFYLGGPCQIGHAAPLLRYTCNKACVQCFSAYGAAYKRERATDERERKAAWRLANPERRKAERERYRDRHLDSIRQRQRDYRARDPYGTIAKREAEARLEAAARMAEKARQRAARKALERAKREAREAQLAEITAMRVAASLAYPGTPVLLSSRRLRERVKRGKHRALKLGRLATLRTHELLEIGNAQGWKCAHCGTVGDLVLDHVRPLALGGHHTANNVQWLCRFHNADKRDRLEIDYRRLRGIPLATPWDVI